MEEVRPAQCDNAFPLPSLTIIPTHISQAHDEEAALQTKLDLLAQMLREARHCVVYTGAGMSTAAGIPVRSGVVWLSGVTYFLLCLFVCLLTGLPRPARCVDAAAKGPGCRGRGGSSWSPRTQQGHARHGAHRSAHGRPFMSTVPSRGSSQHKHSVPPDPSIVGGHGPRSARRLPELRWPAPAQRDSRNTIVRDSRQLPD